MSDLTVLREMLQRAEIDYTEAEDKGAPIEPQGRTNLAVEGGYSGFVSVFTFTAEGALLWVGAYE